MWQISANVTCKWRLSLQNLLGWHHSSNLLAVQLDGGVIKAPTSNPPAVSCTPSELGAEEEDRWISPILFWITGTARHIQLRQYLPPIMTLWWQCTRRGILLLETVFPCTQLSRAQFSFYVFILTYFVLCISFCVMTQSACIRQEGSDWRSNNPHNCLHRQMWQGEHAAGRCAYSVKPMVFVNYSLLQLWVVNLEPANKWQT